MQTEFFCFKTQICVRFVLTRPITNEVHFAELGLGFGFFHSPLAQSAWFEERNIDSYQSEFIIATKHK